MRNLTPTIEEKKELQLDGFFKKGKDKSMEDDVSVDVPAPRGNEKFQSKEPVNDEVGDEPMSVVGVRQLLNTILERQNEIESKVDSVLRQFKEGFQYVENSFSSVFSELKAMKLLFDNVERKVRKTMLV